jgi:hypothetical protein
MLDVNTQLDGLFKQLKKLGSLYQALLEENAELSQKLSLMQNSEAQQEHKLKLMEAELNSLRVAQSMVSNKEEVKLAKAKIGTLVREIDRCIALLNE